MYLKKSGEYINMIKLGIDLDNTIACYDDVYRRLVEQLGIKMHGKKATKSVVKDFLLSQNRGEEWTRLQGEVYGPMMKHAEPFPGALEAIKRLAGNNYECYIISHRSRYPYIGKKYELHSYGANWLENNLGDTKSVLKQIWFLKSKEEKIAKIKDLQIDVFVDDLRDILEAPGMAQLGLRILFDSENRDASKMSDSTIKVVKSWEEVYKSIVGIYES